jgi:hypothetical protein
MKDKRIHKEKKLKMQLTDKTKEIERLRQELHITEVKCADLEASKLKKEIKFIKV